MKNLISFLTLTICGVLAGPAPEVPVDASAELAEFAKGNHLFTTNVYKAMIEKEKGNFIMSPLSAEIVLALTNEGAAGPTSEELQTGLGLPAKKETTQKALKFFLPHLETSRENIKLLSANKIYAGKDVKPKETFVEIADTIYKAGIETVDFAESDKTSKQINEWVESKTNSKIKDLIKKDDVSSDTKVILVNALYFSGKFVNEFEKYATRKDKFYKTKDDVSEVDMMQQTDFFEYYENEKLNTKFIRLPYIDSNVSLVIALPNEVDGLSKLEQNIGQLLEPQPLRYERVDLKMPKFRIESEIQLKPILQGMGVNQIFTAKADLSGMIYPLDRPVYVDKVVQKAFIDVNEHGTEAAASTAVIVEDRISEVQSFVKPLKLYINKPFLYSLYIDDIHAFVGRYNGFLESDLQEKNVDQTTLDDITANEITEKIVTEEPLTTEEIKQDPENPPDVETTPAVDITTQSVSSSQKNSDPKN